jgi:hypothetical protein
MELGTTSSKFRECQQVGQEPCASTLKSECLHEEALLPASICAVMETAVKQKEVKIDSVTGKYALKLLFLNTN